MTTPIVLHVEEAVNASSSTFDGMHEAMEQMMGWGPLGILVFILSIILVAVFIVALLNYLRSHHYVRVDDEVLMEIRRLRREIEDLKLRDKLKDK